jgi:16S rRNA C1402 (ribose-2'-O) methylase RsmI
VKGECVLVLQGAPEQTEVNDDVIVAALREVLSYGQSKRDAVAAVAKDLNIPKNRVYELATNL